MSIIIQQLHIQQSQLVLNQVLKKITLINFKAVLIFIFSIIIYYQIYFLKNGDYKVVY